jgi:hypothetical protein
MSPQPDRRWENIIGGLTPAGPTPMSFEALSDLAAEWAEILPTRFGEDRGPIALLRMARSLFTHSWFDYEFMVVACLIGFQAMEAAFKVLYTDAKPTASFMSLVKRARDDGTLTPEMAEVAWTGVKLRNEFSHPATQTAFTVGMAAPMLETTHRMVALLLSTATHGGARTAPL